MQRSVPAALVGAVATVGAVGVAYASLWERNAFTLRQVGVPALAPGARPLRLLQISDIHMLGRQQRKQEWIRELGRLLPDLVIVTGDCLAGPSGVSATLGALGQLLERPGAFVLGSNDYYAPKPKNPLKYFNPRHKRVQGEPLPWPDLVSGLTGAGWHDLTNVRASLRVDGRRVDLRGLDDPHLRRDRPEAVAGPLDADADVTVGVVHAPEPRVLDRLVADGVPLTLCGHTHGGQLRLPGYGALVTNCGIDRGRCRGLSRYGTGWLHVSAGLGTSPYAPVRFACRPEATLLTLVASDSVVAG